MDKNMEHILQVFPEMLSKMLRSKCRAESGKIFIPKYQAELTPQISQLGEQGAVLDLFLYAPQWKKTLYECSVGMGNDVKTALGMAIGSYIFSFIQGIRMLEENENGRPLTTQFAGHDHRWKVYLSDIVCLGNIKENKAIDTQFYWNLLKDDIVKRMGNQRLSYVKIYVSKMGDTITGECRIDDIRSVELSEKVAKIAENWNVERFASQKQFFFLRQEEETLLPNDYEGTEGESILRDKVERAVRMFHETDTEEEYFSLTERMAKELGDGILAEECFSFLPEFCAEDAFSEASYAETVEFEWPDGRRELVYKNQLADYYAMWIALNTIFKEGQLGEDSDEIYREYVGSSAIYSCFEQVKKSGGDPKNINVQTLLFRVGEKFELR